MERRVFVSLLVEEPLLVYFLEGGSRTGGGARLFASPQTLREELETRRRNEEEFFLGPLLQQLLGYEGYLLGPIWGAGEETEADENLAGEATTAF